MYANSKIPGLTLNEMVVVLILTSIVVGLAFSVLTLAQKHMYGIRTNLNRNSELNKLEQSLWLDFNRYSKIWYDDNKDMLLFRTELDSVVYTFEKSQIVKSRDTFPVQLQHRTFYFNGDAVTKGKIDAIKLITSKAFREQPVFIFKSNDTTLFMN